MRTESPLAAYWEARRYMPEAQAPSVEAVRALLCRPLTEEDIYAADHHPISTKWEDDRLLLGAPYAARHARRACSEGHWGQGVAWAVASVLPGALGVALCCTLVGAAPASFWGSAAQKAAHRRSRVGVQEDRIARDVEAVESSVCTGFLSFGLRRDPLGVAHRNQEILATLAAAVEGLGEPRLRHSKLIRGALREARRAFACQRTAQVKEARKAQERGALCGPVS